MVITQWSDSVTLWLGSHKTTLLRPFEKAGYGWHPEGSGRKCQLPRPFRPWKQPCYNRWPWFLSPASHFMHFPFSGFSCVESPRLFFCFSLFGASFQDRKRLKSRCAKISCGCCKNGCWVNWVSNCWEQHQTTIVDIVFLLLLSSIT